MNIEYTADYKPGLHPDGKSYLALTMFLDACLKPTKDLQQASYLVTAHVRSSYRSYTTGFGVQQRVSRLGLEPHIYKPLAFQLEYGGDWSMLKQLMVRRVQVEYMRLRKDAR